MNDPIQKLADIYPTLENGQKATAREVKAAIEEMQTRIADLESTLSRQPLPEAPASMTAKVIDQSTQIEWLVTVREAGAARLLISAMPSINEALANQGLIAFDVYVDSRRVERAEGNKAQSPLAGLPGPLSINQVPVQSQGQPPLTFEAKLLTATVNDGKAYWKVKGGRFEKFGVTVWPETLEKAGFFVNELNVMESYTLSGWIATYTTKDGDKPDKVIGLAKPA